MCLEMSLFGHSMLFLLSLRILLQLLVQCVYDSFFFGGRYSSDESSFMSSIISSAVIFAVGQRFFVTLCRRPIVLLIDFRRCFWTPFAVNSGNDVSQFLLITRINVVTTGDPNVA